MKNVFFTTDKRSIKPLPYRIYWSVFICLVLIGLADSIYLSVSHYRVYTDLTYKSFCAITKAINCDTVSQSSYSILWGVPVPMWGVFGYLVVFLSGLVCRKKTRENLVIWRVLVLLTLCYSIYSAVLASVSYYYISAWCIMCIASYFVNFFLLFYSWLITRRFDNNGWIDAFHTGKEIFRKKKMRIAFVCLAAGLPMSLVRLYIPQYWIFTPPALEKTIPTGKTEDGHPWIGSENPTLKILEFTDYRCFQCKKMHFFLRQLIAENPGKIQLVHHHFPMEREYNPLVTETLHYGSGTLAMLGIYAAYVGKFWKMNDLLYQVETKGKNMTIDLLQLAVKTGIPPSSLAGAIKHSGVRFLLKRDIAEGIKMGIRGTPSFFIDGNVYLGTIPPEILNRVFNEKKENVQ